MIISIQDWYISIHCITVHEIHYCASSIQDTNKWTKATQQIPMIRKVLKKIIQHNIMSIRKQV